MAMFVVCSQLWLKASSATSRGRLSLHWVLISKIDFQKARDEPEFNAEIWPIYMSAAPIHP